MSRPRVLSVPVLPLHPRQNQQQFAAVSSPPSLSADFFDRQSTADKSNDAKISAQRRQLQQALSMPSQHRWVADWLFVDSDADCHRNIPVPPEAFQNTLAVRINHEFSQFDSSAMCPHMVENGKPGNKCPISGSVPPNNGQSSVKITTADILYLPVASLDGITVGYSFGTGRYVHRIGTQQTGPPFCGRFAFNNVDEELLMVINGIPPGSPKPGRPVTLIMTVSSSVWTNTRKHVFFTCPKMQYGFEHLPSQILSVISAEGTLPEQAGEFPIFDAPEELLEGVGLKSPLGSEYPMEEALSNPVKGTFPEDGTASLLLGENSNGSTVESGNTNATSGDSADRDFVQSLLADMRTPEASPVTRAATIATPWEIGSYGATSDGVGIPRMPGWSPTSCGAFGMGVLSGALGGISRSLRGTFTTTKALERETDGVRVRGRMGSFVRVVAQLEAADEALWSLLQRQAAGLYFAAVTRVRGDEGLVAAVLGVGSMSQSARGEYGTKEERREAKRRRNRMSAARSNQRRKEALESRQMALGELKRRVGELEEQREKLRVENENLKQEIWGEMKRAVGYEAWGQ